MWNTVYGDNALKNKSIFKWIKRFNESRENYKDYARPELPSISTNDKNIDRVASYALLDWQMTVWIIANYRLYDIHV